MRAIEQEINLPEGLFRAKLDLFEDQDKPVLRNIYYKWIELSHDLKKINSRAINIPEGLSEGAFALAMEVGRFIQLIPKSSKANTSFDCYCPKNQERIQVKASSTKYDLSSFGPKSQWDKLYFIDFYKDGAWKGYYDIYLIPNHLIYSHYVNKNETFRELQEQGKRPRLGIKK